MRKYLLCLASACALAISAEASAATVDVIATHGNLYLAGQPNGTAAAGDTLSAANAPLHLSAIGGDIYEFSATGAASYANFDPGVGPDGLGSFQMSADAGTGISGPLTPYYSLLGLFLTSATPSGAAPASLDFTNMDFASVSPLIGQMFVIGDGFRADGTTHQQFVAPTGATRLYLGTMDGSGWSNNFGSFRVTVTDTSAGSGAPEPAGWALMLTGFGGLGAMLRQRRRVATNAA